MSVYNGDNGDGQGAPLLNKSMQSHEIKSLTTEDHKRESQVFSTYLSYQESLIQENCPECTMLNMIRGNEI